MNNKNSQVKEKNLNKKTLFNFVNRLTSYKMIISIFMRFLSIRNFKSQLYIDVKLCTLVENEKRSFRIGLTCLPIKHFWAPNTRNQGLSEKRVENQNDYLMALRQFNESAPVVIQIYFSRKTGQHEHKYP